jgi:hypothetical protein
MDNKVIILFCIFEGAHRYGDFSRWNKVYEWCNGCCRLFRFLSFYYVLLLFLLFTLLSLGSYGSLARYQSISRIYKMNDQVVVAASGDYADFQYIKQTLEELQYYLANLPVFLLVKYQFFL